MPLAIKIAFLSNIAPRPTQKYQNLPLKIVQLVINNNNMLIVSHTSGNITRATPLHVMLDFKTQPFMIDKQLAQELGLIPTNLEPCLFIIVTLIGGTKQANSHTNYSL
uniref:Uncharacterized protein n=1 Tax=Physcomitrium patens TaxID=3218 RepID=A0A2K1KFB6_PHYPA|nr:hypothetical protein PHYPA_008848 [Physcomitrium patens]